MQCLQHEIGNLKEPPSDTIENDHLIGLDKQKEQIHKMKDLLINHDATL